MSAIESQGMLSICVLHWMDRSSPARLTAFVVVVAEFVQVWISLRHPGRRTSEIVYYSSSCSSRTKLKQKEEEDETSWFYFWRKVGLDFWRKVKDDDNDTVKKQRMRKRDAIWWVAQTCMIISNGLKSQRDFHSGKFERWIHSSPSHNSDLFKEGRRNFFSLGVGSLKRKEMPRLFLKTLLIDDDDIDDVYNQQDDRDE